MRGGHGERVVWLDELPLTPSGKPDDKALRELPLPDDTGPFMHRDRQRTRPAIADIMVEFAGAASLDADINFFDAAGTSICAMRVVMAIARNWGVGIPLDAFVATPTAADLARAVTGGIRRILSP